MLLKKNSIFMYKEDLTLNNLQGLIYHKNQPNQKQDNVKEWNKDSNKGWCFQNIKLIVFCFRN